jgi:hypothetical protein
VTQRARAWLLLFLFLGAGTSLPSIDALLFHWRADPLAGRLHVEPAGGCTSHAERCTLRRTPPSSRSLAALATPARTALPLEPSRRPAPATPALDSRATLLPLPRAPPAPLV